MSVAPMISFGSMNCDLVEQSSESVSGLNAHFFESLFERLEDPVFIKNDKHQWLFVNASFRRFLGTDDLIGRTDADFLPANQVAKFYDGDDYVIQNQASLTQEEQIGDDCFALVKKFPIQLPDGSQGLFGMIFDISEYRKARIEVERLRVAKEQSLTDPLTGLSNRRHLDEYFAGLDDQELDREQFLALLHIDLDHFKEINDSKGHAVGDAVLMHVAKTLKQHMRKSDFVARIGGDEFVMIVRTDDLANVDRLADRLVDALSGPATFETESCNLSVSIGVTVEDGNWLSLDHMLKCADIALYQAKENGRGRFKPFSPTLLAEHERKRARRDAFRAALGTEQLLPFYQPQFDCLTKTIVGMEALARWQHPSGQLLTPDHFLDLAASDHKIVNLDFHIMEHAIADMQLLRDAGMVPPPLSVNIAPQSICDPNFTQRLKRLAPQFSYLCIELLESTLLDEPDGVTAANLASLRKLGIKLDIDDFGSGHTSLLGMLQIQPDRIKIDKRLVIPSLTSTIHRDLVTVVVRLAKSLNMKTIAEGVESEQHRELLCDIGCDLIQGFGFARPMPLNELKSLLQS